MDKPTVSKVLREMALIKSQVKDPVMQAKLLAPLESLLATLADGAQSDMFSPPPLVEKSKK